MKNEFKELGSTGLPVMGEYINAAYNADLRMPAAYTDFNRIHRSDPEMAMIRRAFAALAGQQQILVSPPARANAAEERATLFLQQCLEEVADGMPAFKETLVGYVPFWGWGWWEVPLGVRSDSFRAEDDWHSRYNDGLIAPRGLSFRHPSSFYSWEIEPKTKKTTGLVQLDTPNPMVTIPRQRSVHITLGDAINPEGWSPLEAIYRLERYKYSLEIILGMGFEHSSGHVKFTVREQLSSGDESRIAAAARAILSAQEGNYITEIADKFTANLIDVPFAAATALLESIRYYGLLKLQIFSMQWIAIATTAGTGAYAAATDASSMGIMAYNGMTESAIDQLNRQLVTRLFDHPINAAAFAGMVNRPRIMITPVEKTISLNELAQFVQQIAPIVPLTAEDIAAVRRKSGFLPEPDPLTIQTDKQPVPAQTDADFSELAQSSSTLYSPVDDALQTPEYETFVRLVTQGLTAQYRGEQINRLLRSRTLSDAELLELARQLTPPLATEKQTSDWLALLLLFAGIGREIAKQTFGKLTSAQLLQAEKKLSELVSERLLSLLDEEGQMSLTANSVDEIVSLLRQAERLAEVSGDTSLAHVTGLYAELADDAVRSRTDVIAVTELAVAVNAGTRAVGDATNATTKTWLRTKSRVPRAIHLEQVGVTVGYNDRFPDGSDWAGELPNCKCGILLGYE